MKTLTAKHAFDFAPAKQILPTIGQVTNALMGDCDLEIVYLSDCKRVVLCLKM